MIDLSKLSDEEYAAYKKLHANEGNLSKLSDDEFSLIKNIRNKYTSPEKE
jgi:hypothetical protein